jgi:antitoxin component YwqK of YwqJK toxin-antitoxin module
MNQIINGLKEGYWIDYWSNGNPYSKGNYINNEKEGYWEYYNLCGKRIYSKGNYLNGLRHGYWEGYSEHSYLIWKGNYLNDELIGFFLHYDNKGNITQKEFFS